MSWIPISLEHPAVLLLLAASIYWVVGISRDSLAGQSPRLARLALGLRIGLLSLLILALGEASIVHRGEGVTVLVLHDRSASVPASESERIVAELRSGIDRVESGDKIGLIVFGRNAGEEQPPSRQFAPAEGTIRIDREGTNLAGALRLADSVFAQSDATGGRRVVLISDGNATEGDELLEARNLAVGGTVIDTIPIEYFHDREALVESLWVPPQVYPEEPYLIEAVIDSTLPDVANVHLYENDRLVAERTVELSAGKNRIEFSRLQEKSGRFDYRLQLYPGPARDTLSGNNTGFGFTHVAGSLKILFVGDPVPHGSFLKALRSARIEVDLRIPGEVPQRTQDFLAYSAIVLGDVTAFDLGPDAMARIHGVVKNLGLGLLMLGGPSSFGAGGYRGTPIERALPVEMDIKQRKVIPNGALAIILHTCEFPAGNMWAKQITMAAVEALSPRDYIGVLVLGSFGKEGWGIPMQLADDREKIQQQVRLLQPGDMQSFVPTMSAGLTGLKEVSAASKHLLIISDGDPTAPGRALLDGYLKEGISISTICIQPHQPKDSAILKRLAQDTGGRYYRVDDPRKLPQIFFREAISVRRNLILEETFTPRIGAITEPIFGFEESGFPPLHGYVLTTSKPLADVSLVSHQEDPILAQWRYGLGRTAAFTSDAVSRWGRDWVSWVGFEKFWTQLLRSIARSSGDGILELTHSIDGDRGTLILDGIDGEGRFIDGLEIRAQILDPQLGEEQVSFQQIGPGRYQANIDARHAGSYLLALDYEGGGLTGNSITGFDVSYPREYRYLRSHLPRLKQLSEATGGRVITTKTDLFNRDLPIRRESHPIWQLLLQIALILFFIDIFLRRVAIDWSALFHRLLRRERTLASAGAAGGTLIAGTVQRQLETGSVGDPESEARVETRSPEKGVPTSKDSDGATQDQPATQHTSALLRAKREVRKRTEQNRLQKPGSDSPPRDQRKS